MAGSERQKGEGGAEADALLTRRRARRGCIPTIGRRPPQRHDQPCPNLNENARRGRGGVQDAWLAVITGLPGFEGRSSLKSWIFGILVKKVRTRGGRERRTVTFSDLGMEGDPAVDPDRFKANGMWYDPPARWTDITPEPIVAGRQMLEHARAALETLPPAQRSTIILRDVEGLSAEEACAILGVSEVNQRVLLHRARSPMRQAMERFSMAPGASLRSAQSKKV